MGGLFAETNGVSVRVQTFFFRILKNIGLLIGSFNADLCDVRTRHALRLRKRHQLQLLGFHQIKIS